MHAGLDLTLKLPHGAASPGSAKLTCMRYLFVLLLSLASILAFAQDDNNTYGKTETQMLEMGEAKWDDFYEAKAGTSTADMVNMNHLYGEALLHRNERLAQKVGGARKAQVEKLRGLLSDFAGDAIDLGYNFSGGGTIWSPISAEVETASERVLFAILGGSLKPKKHYVVSTVAKALARLKTLIAKDAADPDDASYFKAAKAKGSLDKMNAEFHRILAVAQNLDRDNSDRVLAFCYQYADLARGDFS